MTTRTERRVLAAARRWYRMEIHLRTFRPIVLANHERDLFNILKADAAGRKRRKK